MRKHWIGASAGPFRLVPAFRKGAGVACFVLLLAGCVGLPKHVQKYPSEALRRPDTTALGRIVEHAKEARNLSGIRLLASGDEALASLIALADRAERTLDIQYYIIHQDESAACSAASSTPGGGPRRPRTGAGG